jgi:hypothetical protein
MIVARDGDLGYLQYARLLGDLHAAFAWNAATPRNPSAIQESPLFRKELHCLPRGFRVTHA